MCPRFCSRSQPQRSTRWRPKKSALLTERTPPKKIHLPHRGSAWQVGREVFVLRQRIAGHPRLRRMKPNAMLIVINRNRFPDATHLGNDVGKNTRGGPTKTTDKKVGRLGMTTKVRPGWAEPEDVSGRRDHREPTARAGGRQRRAMSLHRQTPAHNLPSMPINSRRARAKLREETMRKQETRGPRQNRIPTRRLEPTLKSGEPPKVTEPMRTQVRGSKGGNRIPSEIPKAERPQRRNLPTKTRRRLRQGGKKRRVDEVRKPGRRPPLVQGLNSPLKRDTQEIRGVPEEVIALQ